MHFRTIAEIDPRDYVIVTPEVLLLSLSFQVQRCEYLQSKLNGDKIVNIGKHLVLKERYMHFIGTMSSTVDGVFFHDIFKSYIHVATLDIIAIVRARLSFWLSK